MTCNCCCNCEPKVEGFQLSPRAMAVINAHAGKVALPAGFKRYGGLTIDTVWSINPKFVLWLARHSRNTFIQTQAQIFLETL